jgi:RNA polymerase sigma-70 factor, ECF subfamily
VATVAYRVAARRWQRARTHLRLLRRLGAPDDVSGPSADVVAVRDALATLPVAQRAAIVLHHFAGLPVAEVARVLKVQPGTVKARLSRGRAAMALLLEDRPTDSVAVGVAEEQHSRKERNGVR